MNPLEIPQHTKFPPESAKCSYCGDSAHIISKCPTYEFEHDMGTDTDPEWIEGRKMVLARRKALAYGGIPELYLRNPTREQAAKATKYKLDKEEKFKAVVKEFLKDRKKVV